jgi:hypothetical protein
MFTSLQVPMPLILCVMIPKRIAVLRQDNEGFTTLGIGFYPPNSTEEWPKTVGDIKDTHMKRYLEFGGRGAIGRIYNSAYNLLTVQSRWTE